MRKKGFITIVILGLLLSSVNPRFVFATPPDPVAEPGVRIVKSDEHSIILELTTPDFLVAQRAGDNGPCDLITVTNYGETDKAGWPRLPVQGTLVGIPPQSDLTLTVLEIDATVASEYFDLCPVSQLIVDKDMFGNTTYVGEEAIKDASAYASDEFYPTSEAEIVSTSFVRSQRIAQIRFYPFQYNPTSGQLRHLQRIQVRLDFNRATSYSLDANAINAIDEGVFEKTLNHTLLNYDTARQWRTKPMLSAQPDMLSIQTGPSYKITVEQDGIFEVSYADLQAAGVTIGTLDSLDPHTFQIHNQGQEVAIYVTGEEDNSFDPEDVLVFYGQKMDTKYTDTNVYWLTWGEKVGLRMPVADGTPTGTAPSPQYFLTTHRLEEDHWYQSEHASGPDNDRWYWSGILAYATPFTQSYTFTLNHIATAPLSTTVRGIIKGISSATSQHHTQIYLNGYLIDDATWAEEAEYSFEAIAPQSYLNDGLNTLSIVVPLDIGGSPPWEFMWANWFEVDYYTTYIAEDNLQSFDGDGPGNWEFRIGGFSTSTLDILDITSPSIPVRILGSTVEFSSGTYTFTFEHTIITESHYIALSPPNRANPTGIEKDSTSSLQNTTNGADYIIITHADFYTDVLPLVDYRANQGLRTVVVDVQDVYDEFNYGIFDPEAIRDFLEYAYTNWVQPAPVYVLLVGDGNYDFKNNEGRGEPNFIPPYLASIDLWMGEVAADNRYVCVSGDDVFPDMHLGRLPVKTRTEAANVVAKIINYEQNPAGGDWNKKILFVTDNPDSAGNFYAYSDAVADKYVPARYTPQKIYYGLTHSSSSEAQEAIISAINEGQLIVNYVGHGNPQNWAREKLFGFSRVSTLSNEERLPFVVTMACLDGNYIRPSDSSMDRSSTAEAIVRAPGKGAIAAWSATGLGTASAHDYLNKGLFKAIFSNAVTELGPATTQGKLYLYSRTSGHRDQIDEYTLFGDPALQLNVARDSHTTSSSGNWHTSSTWDGGTVPVAGDVVTITTGTSITIDSNTQVHRLTIENGGTLEIPNGVALNVTDALVNNGTLLQTQDVSGALDVNFLATGGYGGVVINANGQALGNTLVEIKGNQDCEGITDEAVERCFEISPANTTGLNATITFYFDSIELVGDSQCDETLEVYHNHGGSWQAETVSARDCSSNLSSITATGVSSFSPFVLRSKDKSTTVTLASFTAMRQGDAISVTWETTMENDNLGFNLYRSVSADGPYTKLNSVLIPSQSPGPSFGATYTWLDKDVQQDIVYYYKLEDVEAGGTYTTHGPITVYSQNPTKLTLVSFRTHGTSNAIIVLVGGLLSINGLVLVWGKRQQRSSKM